MTRPEFDKIIEDGKCWLALKAELDRLSKFAGNKATMGAIFTLVEKIEKERRDGTNQRN